MGRGSKFAKHVTPEHLSCKRDFLIRAPESIARKVVVALLARGGRPTAEEIRRTGAHQLPHGYTYYWDGEKGAG
eukprot:11171431-Lingulodinium_polyedra.AAC.1